MDSRLAVLCRAAVPCVTVVHGEMLMIADREVAL